MKKFLVGFFVFVTIFFLFGGLLLIGAFSTSSKDKKDLNSVNTTQVTYPQKMKKKLSIKQIDSVTSAYNYYFTSANAIKVNKRSQVQ